MSLINEALKKAQRLRTEEPAGIATSAPGSGTRVEKRAEPRSAQQLVVIAGGGVVLVVLSVVLTFWFMNRTPAAKPAPNPVVVKPADSAAPSPEIVPPAIKPPVVAAETPLPTPAPPPVAVAETPASAAVTPPPAVPPPVAAPIAAAPGPTTTDSRVHAFVDALKVMGIRSGSAGDSRVLMNDRVFRVNDIVERNLGVRLTKVEPDRLTFTDANGAIYVKNF
jgi:hypothetical protein